MGDFFLTAGEVREPYRRACYLRHCEEKLKKLTAKLVTEAVMQAATAGAAKGVPLLLRTAQYFRGPTVWQSMSPCMDDLARVAGQYADDLVKETTAIQWGTQPSYPLAPLPEGAANAPLRFIQPGEEFIHYGYAQHATAWRGGARPGTYAGSFFGRPEASTGAQAQNIFNLPRWRQPPDAYYLIRPPKGTPIQGPARVMPAYGRDVPGLRPEFIFPEGTPPGSVSGPFVIPVR